MVDVTAKLSSLSFWAGLSDEEKKLLHLRARAAGLTFCGCAHALYLRKLMRSLRLRHTVAPAEAADVCVGILELDNWENSCFSPSWKPLALKHHTLRSPPEHRSGMFPDWCGADVVFLCCLPSHLHTVCADLRTRLSKHCLIYSFISAVPVTRLAQLLGHNFVLKPQYDLVGDDAADVWLSCSSVSKALNDPSLVEASCPLSMSGGISLSVNWVCAVLYSLLNISTSAGLRSSEALSLISSLFNENSPHTVQLNAQSFISSSGASSLL